jgi:hypothetical protein
VRHAAFQDDRSIAECQPDVVERVQVERERGFDETAAVTDLLDGERLENHHLAVQVSKNFNPLAVALLLRGV